MQHVGAELQVKSCEIGVPACRRLQGSLFRLGCFVATQPRLWVITQSERRGDLDGSIAEILLHCWKVL